MVQAHFVAGLVSVDLSAGPASAQTYPSKPVRIVTSPAGGWNDFPSMRPIA